MLAKVRSLTASHNMAIQNICSRNTGLVIDVIENDFIGELLPSVVDSSQKLLYPYTRPEFLYFSDEEVTLSADQSARPVLCPKDPLKMPAYTGYAEVINAGKTVQNEDQASARILTLVQQGCNAEEARDLTIYDHRSDSDSVSRSSSKVCEHLTENVRAARRYSNADMIVPPNSNSSIKKPMEAAFFAIFDGHAGSGAAIMAANCLHKHIRHRLCQVLERITFLSNSNTFCGCSTQSSADITEEYNSSSFDYSITSDSLVVGAIETAFKDMDDQIAEEKQLWRICGGSTAIASLFFLGKLFIANAGDCRALLITTDNIQQLSQDFTPATERKRLQFIAYKNPDLISKYFSRYEYSRFLTRNDLRRKVFYRDWFMDGWATKTVRESDLKMPMISAHDKKRRLLNTIGVSRGFGDHSLFTADGKIPIKPFLSPVPEVKIFDLKKIDPLSDEDVLVLASDGLWDVLSNNDVTAIVKTALKNSDPTDYLKYTIAAQEVAVAARGNPIETYRWQMSSGGCASTDDITVFIIPLKYAFAPLISRTGNNEGIQ
ncbi:unnamed protein product [Thelazia callipaeda]|uniref:PPM-type phosphatase domain-containing protein n=1 Tax=Thelazia callipaeda TaxID=103827 RepID=A0A0N5D007_THECL|nr:unnamed protein product [Thelazia callipaeda]